MFAYVELKLAWQLHQASPESLGTEDRRKLHEAALRQQALEATLLSSPEAAAAIVTPAAVDRRFRDIRARYEDDAQFAADLARIGLDVAGLQAAVARDLRLESVLERIEGAVPPADDIDAEIFYRLHSARFAAPERRTLRHILLTFRDDADRARAMADIAALRADAVDAEAFAALALRHSQCPTALHGGLLGTVPRGRLFAELDPVAFSLGEDEVSMPVASPMGWHLLRCDRILPAGPRPFEEVREKIRAHLDAARRRQAVKDWLRERRAARQAA